jgi:hypothetical protein
MRIPKQRFEAIIQEEVENLFEEESKYGYSPEQALGYGTVSHKPSRTTEYTTADDEGKTAIVSRGKNPLTGETESGEKTHARDVATGRDRYRALGKSAVKGEKPHPETEWVIWDAEERMDDLFGKSGRRESKQHLRSLFLQELEQMRIDEKKKWIQDAEEDIEGRGTEGVCTGKKFGGPTCRKGTKRYNLAKTFRKMAKKRKGKKKKS